MIEVQEHIPLAAHGTFRIGGPAQFFTVVKTSEEAREAKKMSDELRVPFFVLGGGSNMLFADAGFSGLVAKMAIGGIRSVGECVTVGAGVIWDDFVAWTIAHKLFGLENLSGIPGTVGGAVVGNVGAYGREVCDTLVSVEVIDGEKMRQLTADECRFGYRSSFFKTADGKKLVVVRATFQLHRKPIVAADYPDVHAYFAKEHIAVATVTPHHVRTAVLEIRAKKLPNLQQVGTAGSFFKNPIIGSSVFEKLKKQFPDMPGFSEPDSALRIKVPAGWLLDKVCGLKGKRWGAVGTHSEQALVLVNFGGAAAADVAAAAARMAAATAAATGITLEREVEYL